jgi:hypothetical protein
VPRGLHWTPAASETRDTAVLRAGDYQPWAADPYVYAWHRHDPADDVPIAGNVSYSDRRCPRGTTSVPGCSLNDVRRAGRWTLPGAQAFNYGARIALNPVLAR